MQLLPKRFKLVFRFRDNEQMLLDTLFEFIGFDLELPLSVELVLELI